MIVHLGRAVHFINICRIKKSMSQTSFYKHFWFVKSEKNLTLFMSKNFLEVPKYVFDQIGSTGLLG